jgi:hypothetical protein
MSHERRFLSDASISIHLCAAGSNMRGIESREGDLQGPFPHFRPRRIVAQRKQRMLH